MSLMRRPNAHCLAATVVAWQKHHGRHDLPWQGTHDPYRIWLSEIMLQQTQVGTVIGYYERFLARFPTVADLAQAAQDDVMPYWAGLGYYARARNLHRCAQTVMQQYGGKFPGTAAELATLPGIGRSTAAAIAAFAYGERSPIMDGNVRRVFSRYFGIEGPTGRSATENLLWEAAHAAVDASCPSLDMRRYTQGLMDLGATVCIRRKPECARCPLHTDCYARLHSMQHTLPQPRVRKTTPSRDCIMLIQQHQNRIFLQRQPSPGIWGGLWSLPRFDDVDSMEAALLRQGQALLRRTELPALNHVFTHFKLHIKPVHILVRNPGHGVGEAGPTEAWIAMEDLEATALPAPVKTLLQSLDSAQG